MRTLDLTPSDAPETPDPLALFGGKLTPKTAHTRVARVGEAYFCVDKGDKLWVRARNGAVVKVKLDGKAAATTVRADGEAIGVLVGAGKIAEVSLADASVTSVTPLGKKATGCFLLASLRAGWVASDMHERFVFATDGAPVADPGRVLSRALFRGMAGIPGGEAVAISFADGVDAVALSDGRLERIASVPGAFNVTTQDGRLYLRADSMLWSTAQWA